MHKHLEGLNQFYNERTSSFISVITSHPGKFTPNDLKQFSELIEEIRAEALGKITEFFNNKFSAKSELYDSEVHLFTCRSLITLTQENLLRTS